VCAVFLEPVKQQQQVHTTQQQTGNDSGNSRNQGSPTGIIVICKKGNFAAVGCAAEWKGVGREVDDGEL